MLIATASKLLATPPEVYCTLPLAKLQVKLVMVSSPVSSSPKRCQQLAYERRILFQLQKMRKQHLIAFNIRLRMLVDGSALVAHPFI